MSTQIELNVPESRKTTILCMWWLTADCPCLVFSVSMFPSHRSDHLDDIIHCHRVCGLYGAFSANRIVPYLPCVYQTKYGHPRYRRQWVSAALCGWQGWVLEIVRETMAHIIADQSPRHVGWMPSNKWKLSVKTSVAAARVYADVTLTWLLGLHVTAT